MNKALDNCFSLSVPLRLFAHQYLLGGTLHHFKISLSNGYEGDVIVETLDGKTVAPDPVYGLQIGEPVVPWEGLNTENILQRYSEMADKLELEDPPEREYQLRYDEKTARRKFAIGDLSKTKFNEWEKKPLAEVGDWQCSYCDFKSHCYPVSVFTADVESGVLTIDEAMAELGYDL